jgi:ABC-type nitrate/sulfonate/bicarbonate transport system ATPase subunit
MTLVRVTQVSVDFGDRRVLHALDVDVQEHEQYALVGRSGSGKTTLLLVLAGLLAPTSGTVTRALPVRDILYVPQAPSLIPELTALANAGLGLRVRGIDPASARARAAEELDAFGLSDAYDAMPHELSGGMAQRVSLARSTVVGPRLLLADEPTGSLDQATGQHVLAVLQRLAGDRRMALVVATHDTGVAAALPQRLALHQGQPV